MSPAVRSVKFDREASLAVMFEAFSAAIERVNEERGYSAMCEREGDIFVVIHPDGQVDRYQAEIEVVQ